MSSDVQFVSVAEFSKLSGLSPSTIRRRIDDGSLPKVQLGGPGMRLLIRRDALDLLTTRASDPGAENQPINSGSGPAPTKPPAQLPGPQPRWTTEIRYSPN